MFSQPIHADTFPCLLQQPNIGRFLSHRIAGGSLFSSLRQLKFGLYFDRRIGADKMLPDGLDGLNLGYSFNQPISITSFGPRPCRDFHSEGSSSNQFMKCDDLLC